MAQAFANGVNCVHTVPQGIAQASLEYVRSIERERDAADSLPLENSHEVNDPAQSYPDHGDIPAEKPDIKLASDEEALESEHARIERLGRERPAKFKSFGAELAFCYSIIASQFMAVSSLPYPFTLYSG